MTEPSLDELITVKDDTHKYAFPYFNLRTCCNHNVNGEISLLRSVVKNVKDDAVIFDVGATGSPFPAEVGENMSVHLFDPIFIPSGDEWKNEISYRICRKPVDYSGPNTYVNKNAVDDGENSIALYCKKHDIKHIDFLKIDTDGHDLGVLKGIGDVTVDMVQFEYDHCYRKCNLNIQDMFDLLSDWHFFYILPSGLIKIDKMHSNFLYTNIFASKEYPNKILDDYEITLKDGTINVDHVGEFMMDLYWEDKQMTPDYIKWKCPKLGDEIPKRIYNSDDMLRDYSRIYDGQDEFCKI
jgi:hypothetical protein